ncbi:hypothetical protein [Nesterenkonia sp. DZ6]|uniref:hypothetical protein n=1 Tax=Nesterenkonia sp. DZ6 TaxID=2901229 RepID=UPI001F4CB31E|nr:hypothetical protein [Nesterenkonia sp. DZ6]MCH8560044.1 hypothetical protein [Nesterenkonia sp. DZ6]
MTDEYRHSASGLTSGCEERQVLENINQVRRCASHIVAMKDDCIAAEGTASSMSTCA